MKVKKLIEVLKNQDQELEVYSNGTFFVLPIIFVKEIGISSKNQTFKSYNPNHQEVNIKFYNREYDIDKQEKKVVQIYFG
jgi:hypothetical protein